MPRKHKVLEEDDDDAAAANVDELNADDTWATTNRDKNLKLLDINTLFQVTRLQCFNSPLVSDYVTLRYVDAVI